MSTFNKTAVIITKRELLTSWLNDMISLVGQDCCFYVVPEPTTLKKIDLLFAKLNNKVFGSPKIEASSFKVNIAYYEDNTSDFNDNKYQTVLNFTNLKMSLPESITYYQFFIGKQVFSLYEVIFNTLTSYKKVELLVKSNTNKFSSSTIRLDPFSVTKNTELILSSFLVILKKVIVQKTKINSRHITKKTQSSITLKAYFKYGIRFIKKLKYYFLYNEQWVLGYCFNPKSIGVDLKNDIRIIPPKDRFWADPVTIEDNGRFYIFIEELIYKNKIAHLSVFELKENGSYTKPRIILKKPYHLSYPFVFKHEDKYYMVPETAHNNDVQLYEAEVFPFKWKFKQNLMGNIKASDTTLLYENNKWWLFTSIKRFDNGTYDNDLSIFYSDTLFTTDWIEHGHNPVLQDITGARQGGSFFNIENEYYRVSQNCESTYGYGFNLSKLQTISTTDFKEKKVYGITPKGFKNILAVHTYNQINGKLRVYDLLTRTFKY